MFTRIREFWRDVKAWRRGERRIAPRGVRGRIYEKRAAPLGEIPGGSAGAHRAPTKTTFRMMARVIRADGSPDEHYDLSDGGKPMSAEKYHALKGGKSNG